jgi:RNA polymerase sigma-70 factor (ECF subfamily)
MQQRPSPPAHCEALLLEAWHEHHDRMVARATRMLADAAAAEDVVQEAFRRLDQVSSDEIDDVGGWLAVVVRRLCLNRMHAAHVRREAVGTATSAVADADPADRVTLDDEVQAALALVLDRLTPAERTAFVLHDVFGFPFDAVGTIVGRSPVAVRQLASRARRSIRADDDAPVARRSGWVEHDVVVERFIAACAGGDIGMLVEVLDPEVDGHAELVGFGPIVDQAGRPAVAQRLIALFGPGTGRELVPVAIEDGIGVIALDGGRVVALTRLEQEDGLIRHLRSWVLSRRE